MTAHDLLTFLHDLERRGLDLATIEVNFRHDFDSDVTEVGGVCEDLYDAETNSRLTSIVLYGDDSPVTAGYTTAPQPCRNASVGNEECEGIIPSGAPIYVDELGPYVICRTCESSQDDESTNTED